MATKQKTATQAPTTKAPSLPPRLISFENSHSWIKRCDDQGTSLLQAGYAFNPPRSVVESVPRNGNNVVVNVNGKTRLYGEYACCNLTGKTLDKGDKADSARDSFTAMLKPSDSFRELIVVASHWDRSKAKELCRSLEGDYRAIVNGKEIITRVVKTIPILEGEGTYHLLKGQLAQGDTLLYELGFGTTERRLIQEDGNVAGHDPDESLAIRRLIDTIANDPHIRSCLTQKQQQTSNIALLSNALKTGHLPRLKQPWEIVVRPYIEDWVQSLKDSLLDDPNTATAENWVLTGGGAAIAKPYLGDLCTIPEDPQTASVRGGYSYGVQVIANA